MGGVIARSALLLTILYLAFCEAKSVIIGGEFTDVKSSVSSFGSVYRLKNNSWKVIAQFDSNWTAAVSYASDSAHNIVYIAGPSMRNPSNGNSLGTITAYDTSTDTINEVIIHGISLSNIKALSFSSVNGWLYVAGAFVLDSPRCVGLARWLPASSTWACVADPPAGKTTATTVHVLPGASSGTDRLLVAWENDLYELLGGTWVSLGITNFLQLAECATASSTPLPFLVLASNSTVLRCSATTCVTQYAVVDEYAPAIASIACLDGKLVTATRAHTMITYAPDTLSSITVLFDSFRTPAIHRVLLSPWSNHSRSSDVLVCGVFDSYCKDTTFLSFPGLAHLSMPKWEATPILQSGIGAPVLPRGDWFATGSPDLLFGSFGPDPPSDSGALAHGPGVFAPALAALNMTVDTATQSTTFEPLFDLRTPASHYLTLLTNAVVFDPSRDLFVATMTSPATPLEVVPFNITDLRFPDPGSSRWMLPFFSTVLDVSPSGWFYVVPLNAIPGSDGSSIYALTILNGATYNLTLTLPATAMCSNTVAEGCKITGMVTLADGFVVAVEANSNSLRLFRYFDTHPPHWTVFPSRDLASDATLLNVSRHTVQNLMAFDGNRTIFVSGAISRTLASGATQTGLAAFDTETGADVPLHGWHAAVADVGVDLRVDSLSVARAGDNAWVAAVGIYSGSIFRVLVGDPAATASPMQAVTVDGPASYRDMSGGLIRALFVDPTTFDVVIGGRFTSVNANTRSYLAVLHPDSSSSSRRWVLAPQATNSYPNGPVHALAVRSKPVIRCSDLTTCSECVYRVGCVWCRQGHTNLLTDAKCVDVTLATANWTIGGDHDYDTTCACGPSDCLATEDMWLPWWLFVILAVVLLFLFVPPSYLFISAACERHKERKRLQVFDDLSKTDGGEIAPANADGYRAPEPPRPRQELTPLSGVSATPVVAAPSETSPLDTAAPMGATSSPSGIPAPAETAAQAAIGSGTVPGDPLL